VTQMILESATNFRELGAISTRHGRRIRAGLLYRSGELCNLSPIDLERAAALGISDIVDLRTPDQREARPTRWPAAPAAARWAQDGETSAGELHTLLIDPAVVASSVRERMIGIYQVLPEEQRDSYRLMLRQLAESSGALLVHCTAGKDRTGIIIAFLLDALDVSREAIEAEYELTNHAFNALATMARAKAPYANVAEEVLATALRADPDYLRAAFEVTETRYGSVRAYFDQALGIDEAALKRIAARLLEPVRSPA
jgi:protein-tyrosine phosphatase